MIAFRRFTAPPPEFGACERGSGQRNVVAPTLDAKRLQGLDGAPSWKE
jgi:hypothetical protein